MFYCVFRKDTFTGTRSIGESRVFVTSRKSGENTRKKRIGVFLAFISE